MSGSPSLPESPGVVLVTGAAGGLGGAAARRLTAQGYRVVTADHPRAATGGIDVRFDVTAPDEWGTTVADIEAERGPLDGVLLAHGIVGAEAPVGEYPLDTWELVLRVNLTGCFVGLSTVLPRMAERGRGRVVAVASIAGREPNPHQAAYSASKSGVISLVKTTAKEYASRGVYVNAIAPGVIETPLAATISPELRASILSRVPLGRFGEPDEFAALAGFLLSDDLSYTTGQVFDISGGRAAGW